MAVSWMQVRHSRLSAARSQETKKWESGERRAETGKRRPETGDRRPETGKRKAESGKRRICVGTLSRRSECANGAREDSPGQSEERAPPWVTPPQRERAL